MKFKLRRKRNKGNIAMEIVASENYSVKIKRATEDKISEAKHVEAA